LVAAWGIGCGEKPDQGQDDTGSLVDVDGDGVAAADDCDDTNNQVFPGADEICDGLDNDCDGNADGADVVDGTTSYADDDGDGFGNPKVETYDCEIPSDYVENALDCDDSDSAIHPEATEVCDGLDNDCDESTGEFGLAAWVSESGVLDDLGDSLRGSIQSPAEIVLDEPGVLQFCEGTFYVGVEAQADVSILGLGDTSGSVVLDAGGHGSVVQTSLDRVELAVENVSLSGGTGTFYDATGNDPAYWGGAIYCNFPDATSEADFSSLSLLNVRLLQNEADHGGAVFANNCAVDASGADFTDNTASWAGGAIVQVGARLELTEVLISSNTATMMGGGILYLNGEAGLQTLVFDEVEVVENQSEMWSGVYVSNADLLWTGSSSTGSGLRGNESGVALPALEVHGVFTAQSVDFGSTGSADDNDFYDLKFSGKGSAYLLGDDESFECDEGGVCGKPTDYQLSSAEAGSDLPTGFFIANTALAMSDGTLESFSMNLGSVKGNCHAFPRILSSAGGTGSSSIHQWDDVSSYTSVTLGTTVAETEVHVGKILEKGRTYAFGMEFQCTNDLVLYHMDTGVNSGVDFGIGVSTGYAHESKGLVGTTPSTTVGSNLMAPFTMTLSVSDL